SLFTAANFPGSSQTQRTQAANFYGVLTGRITAISGTAALSETTNKYTNLGNYTERDHQREIGMFASDTWRFRPNLTLTGGLRWEIEFPFTPLNNNYSQTTLDQLFGISGTGNIFSSAAGTAAAAAPTV